jgi:hypothetical protein
LARETYSCPSRRCEIWDSLGEFEGSALVAAENGLQVDHLKKNLKPFPSHVLSVGVRGVFKLFDGIEFTHI